MDLVYASGPPLQGLEVETSRLRLSAKISVHQDASRVKRAMGEAVETNRKRLFITPFSQDLLERFVPTSLQPLASGISFHTVETFPERAFGYVELPTMEAEKVRKKLNGATLKGTKVKIEDAKPEKKRKAEGETEEERKVRKKVKKERRQREEGVLVGHELEDGRRVKRGWTEAGSEKKRDKKSKMVKAADEGLEGKKLKFRTTVPPNKEPAEIKAAKKIEGKKDKKEKKAKRKTVVQEFAKAQKSEVIDGGAVDGQPSAHYDDENGWVDRAGEVVEAAPVSKRPKRKSRLLVEKPAQVAAIEAVDDPEVDSDEEVSSVVSSDTPSEQSETESYHAASEQTTVPIEQPSTFGEPDVGTRADGDVVDIPLEAAAVHPLEALFKRPAAKPESATKPKPSPIDTSFSFFQPGNAEEPDEDGTGYPPQTPHTKEDLEWRSIRSAAPTPDTAAIGKRFEFPPPRDSDDDEEEEDQQELDREVRQAELDGGVDMIDRGEDARAGAVDGEREESAFRKWFYENRGDLNRSWKKRRRDERKQKRQRENKRLGRRLA